MLKSENVIFETDSEECLPDPDFSPIRDRKVVSQPYDLAIDTIVNQIKDKVIFLRPLSARPLYQRQYVWNDTQASKLVESVLLNIPIPPCYLSENEDSEMDVIDGQQRIYSLYRYLNNQFGLRGLEALTELNGRKFFEIDSRDQRKIKTHIIRCVVISNESHPEIKFDVFERFNTSTVPLSAQELRNCVWRGPLNDLLAELSIGNDWLSIRGRKIPDKRLADEEIILRYFSYQIQKLESYKTPLRKWLDETARRGRVLDLQEIERLRGIWKNALKVARVWFSDDQCFRRPNGNAINRALFDLIMWTATPLNEGKALSKKTEFNRTFVGLVNDATFSDLISRAVDHKKRTELRFFLWQEAMARIGL